ncbi:MAG: PASTA domain-containing protein [Oscillospiraceae bacterium]|jgi:stage V sporulation protein D (sporulation-specific penicillin-binding protein)|nr:PASTA domain-containing protein [Oscillospiraceae bacterium]
MRKDKAARTTREKQTKSGFQRTIALMLIFGIVTFGAVSVKLYIVQVMQHDKYESQALNQQTRETKIAAARGTIYDVNGKVLATSASVDTVFISPYEMVDFHEDGAKIATRLSEILGIDRETIVAMQQDTKSWYKRVALKVEEDVAAQIREYIKEGEVPLVEGATKKKSLRSVHLEPDSKRYYPLGSLAAQVIGFVGDDNTGLEGLERKYNEYLTGTPGRVVRLKNAGGTDMLFNDFEDYYDAEDGDSITLTMDAIIQSKIEKHLSQAIEDYDIQNGAAAIAMNPKTGEVIAMVSLGSYDLNNFLAIDPVKQDAIDQISDIEQRKAAKQEALFAQQRNKSLTDTYEPGSVFKIITLAMALDEGVINANDSFFCGGQLSASAIPGRTAALNCWKHAGHGTQTLAQALQNSCNIAFANIGMRVGAETFYKYIDAFGFMDKTGFDLPGEGTSLWWPEENFRNPKDKSSLVAASFGQTFNITPLQLVTAVSATVNGGNLMQAHVVKQITDADGNIVKLNEPTVVRQVISKETSDTVRAMLESVVSVGTGGNARVNGYRVGGKTGTSEKVAQQASRDPGAAKDYIVSFCGVAPMDDPQVVILLLLDTPSNKSGVYISGGNMAAPVMGKILEDILPDLGVLPQYTEAERAALNVAVPNTVGKTVEEAKTLITDKKLAVEVKGDGATITAQLPAAKAVVSPDTKVILYTTGTTPPEQELVAVPNLSGRSYKNAKTALERVGLFIRSTGAISTLSSAEVSTQSTAPGEMLEYGSVIEVVLVDGAIVGNY